MSNDPTQPHKTQPTGFDANNQVKTLEDLRRLEASQPRWQIEQ